MTYSLHRGAEQDLLEAAQFYRREGGSRVASRFVSEFEGVAQLVVEFPGIGTPTDGLRRVHPLRDFPYSVIYRLADGEVRILVVRGQLRDPEYGDSRRQLAFRAMPNPTLNRACNSGRRPLPHAG